MKQINTCCFQFFDCSLLWKFFFLHESHGSKLASQAQKTWRFTVLSFMGVFFALKGHSFFESLSSL